MDTPGSSKDGAVGDFLARSPLPARPPAAPASTHLREWHVDFLRSKEGFPIGSKTSSTRVSVIQSGRPTSCSPTMSMSSTPTR
eukprot:5052475-Prymnesium_polylepis.1